VPSSDAHISAADIEAAIRAACRPERADGTKRYLKTDLDVLGGSVGAVRAVVTAHKRGNPEPTREHVVALVEALWDRPILECRLAAVEALTAYVRLLTASELDVVERLVRQASTWALVDPLAINVAGPIVERAGAGAVLDRWAGDGDFWIRRSALLALLVPLRRGDGDWDRFSRYADAMLDEKEFFIRKAIGWVLRDTGRRRPEIVAAWLEPRIEHASGVTVREAVKPLPDACGRRSWPGARASPVELP
jgi:3-methyladenine DNA glycosylase AlkD